MICQNINTYTHNQPQAKIKSKQVYFGSLERTGINIFTNATCQNNTWLLRSDLNWKSLANYIAGKGKPQKIYCYACSDGSEPYSIAISLINKLGWDKAKEHFPIIARDVDPFVINRAKDGHITLGDTDLKKLKSLNSPEILSLFKPSGIDDCTSDGHFYFVDKKLQDCINFEKGNIVEDSEKLDFKNSLLFFRNAWRYLNEKEQKQLLSNISHRFDESASLVTGNLEKDSFYEKYGTTHAFDDFLFEGGLWQVRPHIYEKANLYPNILDPRNYPKIILNSTKAFLQNYGEYLKGIFTE